MSADGYEFCPEDFCNEVGDSEGIPEYEYRNVRVDHDGPETRYHCYVCGYSLVTGLGKHKETRGTRENIARYKG
jgi:hypothetical protein